MLLLSVFSRVPPEYRGVLDRWTSLLTSPLSSFRNISVNQPSGRLLWKPQLLFFTLITKATTRQWIHVSCQYGAQQLERQRESRRGHGQTEWLWRGQDHGRRPRGGLEPGHRAELPGSARHLPTLWKEEDYSVGRRKDVWWVESSLNQKNNKWAFNWLFSKFLLITTFNCSLLYEIWGDGKGCDPSLVFTLQSGRS